MSAVTWNLILWLGMIEGLGILYLSAVQHYIMQPHKGRIGAENKSSQAFRIAESSIIPGLPNQANFGPDVPSKVTTSHSNKTL